MVSAERPVDRPASGTNYLMNAVRISAALLVVFSHVRPMFFVDFADSPDQGPLTRVLYAVTSLGDPAVIIFFVLSGYWVGGAVIRSVTTGRFRTAAYSIARLSRLWVVLLPALLLTQILDRMGTALWPESDVYQGSSAYHMPVSEGGPVAELGAVDTLGNVLFLQRLYVPALGSNGPLWSLASEFWYYLLFPAILLAVLGRAKWVTRIVAACVVGATILLLSLATDPAATPVIAQFPTWLLGAFLAWQRDRVVSLLARLRPSVITVGRVVAIAAVLGCAVVSKGGPMWGGYALASATMLMLALFIPDVSAPAARVALRPISWSAEWSFSLYATHMPVVAFLAAMLVPFAADRWTMTPTSFLALLGLSLVPMAVAILFYMLTEKHTNTVRRHVSRWIRTDQSIAPQSAARVDRR